MKPLPSWINSLSFAFCFLFMMFHANAQDVSSFEIANQVVSVSGDLSGFDLDVQVSRVEDGLEIATIKITHETGDVPPQLSLKWQMPSTNVAGYWSTSAYMNKTIKPDWWPSKVTSMLARQAPVITLYGHQDENRTTFAVSDPENTIVSSTSVREEDGLLYNEVTLFSEVHKKLKTYEVQLRMDSRSVLYSESLDDVATWWASFDEYEPLFVPDVARLPVYSTWYSYHQNVSADSIIEECKIAKAMGFESIIVDDGWQTLDGNRGYAYTGDWEPMRIPDIKDVVQQVHDIGMKFVLWYALPFVGEKSKSYEKMKGKFLRYWDGQGAYVLDPRYPEVRAYIIQIYVDALQKWNLDGFKLDFIARFNADENTVLTKENGRDYASVNEATDVLMTKLVKTLKGINPDIMMEFRQPYIGPVMRKYGNMFRAGDCPNLALINRVRTTDLRLLSGNTSVHSDMLMWHYDEPVELAALQLVNVLFSVPQISVRLKDIPDDHFQMIKFYTSYWLQNRSVFLDGTFHAHAPLSNYPMISGSTDDKRIVSLYNDQVVDVVSGKYNLLDVINGKASERIILSVTGEAKNYNYTVRNCLGEVLESSDVVLEAGLYEYNVPCSGMISFQKK